MAHLSSIILRAFYAIEESRITADILGAVANPAAIHTELRNLRHRFRDEGYSPQLNAVWAHVHLVQAVALHRSPAIPREFSTFQAVHAARRISGESEALAMTQSPLAALLAAMGEQRLAGGLAGDEDWSEASTPPAYRLLIEEFSRRMDAVGSTILESVLRRYSLGAISDLLERDELEFNIQMEVGRRVAFSRVQTFGDFEDLNDTVGGASFPTETWQRIKARVNEILGSPPFKPR